MEIPFRYTLTVTELTQQIKDLLEIKFSEVWVEGEISNLRIPPSGHLYFTLKDEFSQIRAVFFKMQARTLRYMPEEGLQVICRGRIGVYEKRGDYQLILDAMEPRGMGVLQLAFLQLKERLEKEGLFDPVHKKPIPMVPEKIGIITSPTGSVIQDMLHILDRRFKNIQVLLYPVRVQGEGASEEIIKGIDYFNKQGEVDVIILGRGGGAFEDLWAFNEEGVARAIYDSNIPIISAVGHETDYTISDFVADLRAPTPSAAAELAVKNKQEIQKMLSYFKNRIRSQIEQTLQEYQSNLSHLRKGLINPQRRIETYLLRTDELSSRLALLASRMLKRHREKALHVQERIFLRHPIQTINNLRQWISQRHDRAEMKVRHRVELEMQRVNGIRGKLESLSPLAILKRGYSITRSLPSLKILRDAAGLREGDRVEVKLFQDTLFCGIEKIQQ
jgi:exodeoxyribonuclease VII large subunit